MRIFLTGGLVFVAVKQQALYCHDFPSRFIFKREAEQADD
jgi:hypothetical protein